MADLLAGHAAAQPDKPALVCDGAQRTFAELNAAANRAARVLGGLGLASGCRVAFMTFNSMAGSVASHAVAKLDGIAVPVNFRLGPAEVAHVLNESEAGAVCAGPAHIPVLEAARPLLRAAPIMIALEPGPPPGWIDLQSAASVMDSSNIEAAPSSALGASMIFTSGTTGRPKGAFRPRGLPPEAVMETIGAFDLSGSDVHLVAGPAYHSAVGYFAALHSLLGATVVLMPRFDPEEALRLFERHRVTTTFMAPILVRRLCDLPPASVADRDLTPLRAVIMSAAPCPFDVKRRFVERFGPVLWDFYGATETGINLLLRPEEQLSHPGSCGRPLPGQEIILLDDRGQPVPDGEPGLLWVRNAWLAEYYHRPEATAESTHDGYFSVGDVAFRDREGFFHICDRRVDMIISGGVNIYPAEIEAELHSHPEVSDCAVIGIPDPEWGESVHALVVPRQGSTRDGEALRRWCRQRLAGYKVPRTVEFRDSLPRGADGKMLKRELREPFWSRQARAV